MQVSEIFTEIKIKLKSLAVKKMQKALAGSTKMMIKVRGLYIILIFWLNENYLSNDKRVPGSEENFPL